MSTDSYKSYFGVSALSIGAAYGACSFVSVSKKYPTTNKYITNFHRSEERGLGIWKCTRGMTNIKIVTKNTKHMKSVESVRIRRGKKTSKNQERKNKKEWQKKQASWHTPRMWLLKANSLYTLTYEICCWGTETELINWFFFCFIQWNAHLPFWNVWIFCFMHNKCIHLRTHSTSLCTQDDVYRQVFGVFLSAVIKKGSRKFSTFAS